MKRIFLLFSITSLIFFCYCASTKTAVVTPNTPTKLPVTITYDKHIQPLLVQYCAPCHFPAQDGDDGPLDTYDTTKAQINDIIYRIELRPGERGYMPAKARPLPDSVIALFKVWKKEGMGR